MASWSKTTKHLPSEINNGNKYEIKDRLVLEQLNAITENSFYASEKVDTVISDAENIVAGGKAEIQSATSQGKAEIENTTSQGKNELNAIVDDAEDLVAKANASINTVVGTANEALFTVQQVVASKGYYGSNPNLLINGDFRVNQRGLTSYTAPTNSNKTYCVDRFYINWGTSLTSINNNSITLQFNRQYAVFGQVVEDFNKYRGKILTLSVKVSNVSTPQNLYLRFDDGVVHQSTLINGNGIFSKTFTISDNATQLTCVIFNTNATGTTITLDVEYMKLEIGSVATPFSPRPYAEELALCQRYSIPINTTQYSGRTFFAEDTSCVVFIATPTTMRVPKSITLNDITIYCNGVSKTTTDYSIEKLSSNGVVIRFNISTGFGAKQVVLASVGTGFIDAEIY